MVDTLPLNIYYKIGFLLVIGCAVLVVIEAFRNLQNPDWIGISILLALIGSISILWIYGIHIDKKTLKKLGVDN